MICVLAIENHVFLPHFEKNSYVSNSSRTSVFSTFLEPFVYTQIVRSYLGGTQICLRISVAIRVCLLHVCHLKRSPRSVNPTFGGEDCFQIGCSISVLF